MARTTKHLERAVSPQAGEADTPVFIELTIRLSNGHFSSSLTLPLDATDDERRKFVDAWLAMMDAGIKCGQTPR